MIRLFEFFKRHGSSQRSARSGTPPRETWSASEWARVRAPERHRDQAISNRARRWLERLPADMRPSELCERYPRIVNQLAVCWRDHGLTEHLLSTLLTDTRGGRIGFAPTIVAELEVLYELHDQRSSMPTVPSEAWGSPTQP